MTPPIADLEKRVIALVDEAAGRYRMNGTFPRQFLIDNITTALQAARPIVGEDLEKGARELCQEIQDAYGAQISAEAIATFAEAAADAARKDERERCAKIADVCSCGSGPEFRPVDQRYHLATCTKHVATMIRLCEGEVLNNEN